MHATMRNRSLKPWIENLVIVVVSITAVIMAITLDKAGMPHKWHTAIFGTLVPFTTVLLLRRTSWARQTFWMSLWLLLAIHSFVICVVFGIVLRHVNTLGLLWWLPIAFVEVFVLTEFQPRVEKWLRVRRSD